MCLVLDDYGVNIEKKRGCCSETSPFSFRYLIFLLLYIYLSKYITTYELIFILSAFCA